MRTFLALLIMSTSWLMGAYDIKIGVFSNAKNLAKNIQKIKSTKYRNAIIVKKKNHLHYVHAVIHGSGRNAKQALVQYQTIFPDAFISKRIPIHAVQKRDVKSTIPHVKSVAKLLVKPVQKTKIKKKIIKREPFDTTALVVGKTMYVCYEDAPIGLSAQLVQMDFGENIISYFSLGKKHTLKIPYAILMDRIRFKLSDIEMIHKILEDKGDYYLVESYVKDKKMYTLRYYKTKEKALEYLSKG